MTTIADIRLANARTLSAMEGGIAAFARRTDMSDSQVSQIIGSKPTKQIGNIIARRIESAFGKDTGWMDQDHTKTGSGDSGIPPDDQRLVDPDELSLLIKNYCASTSEGRRFILASSINADKILDTTDQS